MLDRRSKSWADVDRATEYARAQKPDTYSVATSKNNESEWYCSKLVWRSYMEGFGLDIDRDGGYYVYPDDIETSPHLSTVYWWVNTL